MYSLFVSLVAAIGGFLFGYNSCIIAGAILFIAKEFQFSIFEQGLIISILLIGALIGAFFGGNLADKIGRKKTFYTTLLFFITGTLILVFSRHFHFFMLGRFIVGCAIGIVSITSPMYIAEMSPPKHRGALVSLNQLFITIGVLVSYFTSYIFAKEEHWHKMFAVGIIPAVIMFFALFLIPESPSWLAKNGLFKKAEKIRRKIIKNNEEINDFSHREIPSSWKSLLHKSIRPALIVGIGISIIQQVTGINTIIYYAPRLFQMAGFNNPSSAIFISVIMATINVFVTIIALWLIDVLGRRCLLITGVSGMVVSLLALAAAFLFSASYLKIFASIFIISYISCFAFSLGPITWLLISEIFPIDVRGKAMGVATCFNWFFNYFVSLTFLILVKHFSVSTTFLGYSVIGIFALWFIYKKVPETKGKMLGKDFFHST